MPTYVYQCKTCNHQFEKVQSFHDAPLTECSACGGEVRRVIFPSGVIFKGSGWYITDSRKSSESESKVATASTKSTASETGGATSDGAAGSESNATKAAEKVTATADSE